MPGLSKLRRSAPIGVWSPNLILYDNETPRRIMREVHLDYPVIPTVFVDWDNTPRRSKDGRFIVDSLPSSFEEDLRHAFNAIQLQPNNLRLLFINAWNEWAEGNLHEPDLKTIAITLMW